MVFALTAPINHDESQYVAGGVLAATTLPFRDFMAMQPPLALWVWAALAAAFPGWSFLAIRMSSAVFGLVTLIALAGVERHITPHRRWPLGAVLMACCHPFLFTSSVARNDALPGMLLTIGMLASLRGLRGCVQTSFAAGLFMGGAAAAKLSFAPSAAATFLMFLIGRDRRSLLSITGGMLAGLMPLAIPFAIAPDAALFGLIKAPLAAPLDWYERTGDSFDLTFAGKLAGTGGAMLVGPAFVALLVVAAKATRLAQTSERRFLLVLTAAGLIGAMLPTPAHPQYLLPALPPLFALVPAALEDVRHRRTIAVALSVFGIVGVIPSLLSLTATPALGLERQAHDIGSIAHGPIATLSPERVVDSGLAIDPRFATGPFLFRSGSTLRVRDALRFNVATPATLEAMFRDRPPNAILAGYEDAWGAQSNPDAPLVNWAKRHGFRESTLSDGRGKLFHAEGSDQRLATSAAGRE